MGQIIVSFTTWKKRIGLSISVFQRMAAQTLSPYKTVLVLSEEEFPDREGSLPMDLVEYVETHRETDIIWVKENSGVWKKFIPTMEKYPESTIIPIDDDIPYPPFYIERLYKEFVKEGEICPMACFRNRRSNGLYYHSGPFSITKSEFYGKYLKEIYEGLVLKHPEIRWHSDELYGYAAWLNGFRYKYSPCINAKELYKMQFAQDTRYSYYGKTYKEDNDYQRELIENFILERYGKTLNDILKSEIVVNVTTYPKRQRFLRASLQSIADQSLKPDRVILYLSEEEYDKNKLPIEISSLIDDGLINEIIFCRGNTYCHKRWDFMKELSKNYVITIDDDIIYDKDYIKELIEKAMVSQSNVIMWTSRRNVFHGVQRKFEELKPGFEGHSVQLYVGVSCFPPFTFPIEALSDTARRDRIIPKNDEAWLFAWLLKKGTKKVSIHNLSDTKWQLIKGSQQESLFSVTRQKNKDGIVRYVSDLARYLHATGNIKEAKKIFKEWDIEACL